MRSSARALQVKAAAAALVVAAVLAAFAPALDNGFVAWDDVVYLVSNPALHGSWAATWRWAWTTTLYGLYQPLTWLSFRLDYALWGLDPAGYHLTNVVLQALAAGLCFLALGRLLGLAGVEDPRARLWGAAAGALFFAVHPLRVESVAWATERKDVLSGVFWLGGLVCYLGAAAAPRHRRAGLIAAFALFATGLLAKASGMTLPVVLVILDICPLRRLSWDVRRWAQPGARAALREKLPFAALGAVSTAVAAWALRRGAGIVPLSERGWLYRLDQGLYGVWFYPWKTLWPFGLSPYHSIPVWFGEWGPQPAALAALTIVAALGAWRLRRRFPGVPAALLYYVVVFFPMLGLVQNGVPYSAFERYGYLPSLGFAALFAAAAARVATRGPWARGGVALALASLGALTWRQTGVWRDSVTLWTSAALSNPGYAVAWGNKGAAEADAGRLAEGLASLERAAAEDPQLTGVFENIGAVCRKLGRPACAERAYRRAVERAPGSSVALAGLGSLLAQGPVSGAGEARDLLERALAAGARGADVHDDLALAYSRLGLVARARAEYRAAIAADPEDGAALCNLGLLAASRGRRDEAVAFYRAALRRPAARAEAHYNWGNLLLAAGELDGAARHYREALRLYPGFAKAEVNWGNALARGGRLDEAARRYRAALRLDPGSFEARANLGAVTRRLRR